MTSKSRLIAIATVLGVAFTSLPADSQPAQPTKEARDEAKTRFLKGLELFREGDYQAALIEFRRANELAPNFNVLYNIGQVYFQLTDYPNALVSLERYLSEGGDQISAKRREEVQKDIDKLRARIANLEITTNVPDVDIAIDDVPHGKTPFQKPLMVGAGRHRITASKEGFRSVTKLVEVAGADSLKIPLVLEARES
ncbi:MAG: PEGA domain-containing protein, partial [Polyangiaceae bacterium]|nr:PEGA domain-containing protein [Polyangiaceae bacterium]